MTQYLQFTAFSRILHWTMAVLVLAMLFIGIGMVSSLSDYHWLVSIHRPLGILILILVAIRLVNRLLNPAPAVAPGHAGVAAFRGTCIACRSVRADVRLAARRLGNAVGTLSDRGLWAAGIAADPAA
jgi:cytochrome b